MNLKDKLEAELQNEPLIFLYMEGMFWKAYEQSAMRFTKEVKSYRLQKRFVKTVNSEIVSMGFPNGSLQDVLKGRDFMKVNVKNELIALLVCIYQANSTTQKSVYLQKAREHVVVVKLQIRLLMDLKQINLKQYATAADFRDRIVHHLLFNYISPIFERIFIDDCYSCRKGKGTLFGIKRLDKHIRGCSQNYTRDCYVLKLDLQGYFMNINRQILYDDILQTLERYGYLEMPDSIHWEDSEEYELVKYLLPLIVFNDPTLNCIRRGDISGWEGLPPSKSLFHSPPGCGLPIGNLTSQLFSNIYLAPFDNYVKRTLRIKHYGRYVDDFFLVHEDREVLKQLIPEIRDYLWETLHVRLHPNKIVLQHFCTLNIKKEIVSRCSQIFLYGYFGNGLNKYILRKHLKST